MVRKLRDQQGTKEKTAAEEREGDREEARNGKDVQKQDGAGKVVEALSQWLRVLAQTFPNLVSSKIPNAKAPQHTPYDAVHLALVAGAVEQTWAGRRRRKQRRWGAGGSRACPEMPSLGPGRAS